MKILVRRKVALPAMAMAMAAVLVLAGCGGTYPGSAAVVEGNTISHDEIDDIAAALCSAQLALAEAQQQEAPVVGTTGARKAALELILNSRLALEFGEEQGVSADEDTVRSTMEGVEGVIRLIPRSQQDDLRTLLRADSEGREMINAAGRKSLEDAGQDGVTEDQARAAGDELFAAFADRVDVEVDPRYGSYSGSQINLGDGSLSIAQSENALAAANAEVPADYVESLPATQKCG